LHHDLEVHWNSRTDPKANRSSVLLMHPAYVLMQELAFRATSTEFATAQVPTLRLRQSNEVPGRNGPFVASSFLSRSASHRLAAGPPSRWRHSLTFAPLHPCRAHRSADRCIVTAPLSQTVHRLCLRSSATDAARTAGAQLNDIVARGPFGRFPLGIPHSPALQTGQYPACNLTSRNRHRRTGILGMPHSTYASGHSVTTKKTFRRRAFVVFRPRRA
jgi:hypothetical protein